jgi:Kae1-associated kinase Bud32
LTESTYPGGTDLSPGKLLYRGAEADVILGSWEGLDAVYKVRKPLPYRLSVLDDSIRRQRTLREAEMIHQAKKAGVSSPFLYDVDVPGATLVMEYIRGERLRDLVGTLDESETDEVFFEFGRDVAKLHSSGMMHGDLTTANVVRRDGRIVFIDFGLSVRTTKLEDQAVDMRLIKETLIGAHSDVASSALEAIYRGYAAQVGTSRFKSVHRQLQSIERRGRYARVA